MTRRFILRPGLEKTLVEGVGEVRSGQVLEGDKYKGRKDLVEILDSEPVSEGNVVAGVSTPRTKYLIEG